MMQVAGTGAACLLIHRTVLEKIGEKGPCWFDNMPAKDRKTWMGEDFSFCRRVREAGFPVHVYTGARTSHHKDVWFTEDDYNDLRRPATAAVSVVIPVKDNLDLTRSLVSQLQDQGGYSDILLFDNGSTDPKMRAWLEGQQTATVFDASEASGISHMWNAGISEAHRRHGPNVDVVFLNNDLVIGNRFLRRLIVGLYTQRALQAVCGNYDDRPVRGVVPLRGICAGRYDGTGGLAGFAFALKAEWLAGGFRFDEDMAWWYSDNDLTLELEKAGAWYGLVSDAAVDHVGGGSQTFDQTEFAERIAKDRAAFEAKWPQIADVTLPRSARLGQLA
jgi:GT2 family glycosyltransferase